MKTRFSLLLSCILILSWCTCTQMTPQQIPTNEPLIVEWNNQLEWKIQMTFNQFEVAQAPIDEIINTPVVFENKDSWFKLAGIIYMPKDIKEGDKLPAIVVQWPMWATKEQTQSLYAQFLASRWYITMVYDYSYIWASEWSPKWYEDPEVKASDINSAIDFLSTYEYVDSERIWAVGICWSGVYIINAAYKWNEKLKAMVSVNPFAIIDAMPVDEESVRWDKEAYERWEPAKRIDLITEWSEWWEYYFNPRRWAAVNRVVFPTWSQPTWSAFHPTQLAADIEIPYLLIIWENAFTRQWAEAMFDNYGWEDKEKFVIANAKHFDMYDGAEYVPQAIDKIVEFFNNHL